MSTTAKNIHFTKNGQTRYVKHGFSWQLALFGPITYFWRGQYLLMALSIPLLWMLFALTAALASVFVSADDLCLAIALVVTCGLHGAFGNRLSARSYVKNGWKPVSEFPADWNHPVLIPTAAASVAPNTVV